MFSMCLLVSWLGWHGKMRAREEGQERNAVLLFLMVFAAGSLSVVNGRASVQFNLPCRHWSAGV